jgi:RHS repeat-associated protein
MSRAALHWVALVSVRLRILAAFLLFTGLPLYAQLTTAEEKGLPPNSVFHLGDIDAVNLQNGNLHISIPIASEKQRGGMTLNWTLVYDTPTWLKEWVPDFCASQTPADKKVVVGQNPPPLPPCPVTGQYDVSETGQSSTNWRFTNPYQWAASGTKHVDNCPTPVFVSGGGPPYDYNMYYLYTYYTNWVVRDYQGTAHPVPIRAENYNAGGTSASNINCLGSSLQGPALDGSGILLNTPNGFDSTNSVIYTKDGAQMLYTPYQIRDANGNLVTATADTLGRNIVTTSNDPNYPPPGTGPALHVIYTVNDSNGNPQQYHVDYEEVQWTSTACPQSGVGLAPSGQPQCNEISTTGIEVSRITLPDQKAYVFTYNAGSPGELSRIDLPTGGSISYTYTDFYQVSYSPGKGLRNNVVGGRAVQTRTVTIDGQSYKWTYNPTASSDKVTDPDGNIQVHNFGPAGVVVGSASYSSTSKYETSTTYADPTGHVLRSTQTDYAAEFAPMDSGVANVRPIRVTTTLDSGLVTKKETDYETFSYTCNPCQGGGGVASRLNPTEVREFDYGAGAPGPLVRRTDYTYLHNNNASYTPLNIVDKPVIVSTYDGAGNLAAQATYEYDNYTRSNQTIQASGAIQHDTGFGTTYHTRGNVTAVSHWLNTTNSLLTTTSQYDDAGNILSTIDPKGNLTSFSFGDSWANTACAPSGQTKAFPTSVTNAKGQTTTSQYNFCTGTIASSTDPNHKTTSISYDLLNRPSQVNYPDGGSTGYCYSDDPNSSCSGPMFSMVATTAVSQGASKITTMVYDGLGQVKQTQLNSDPSGTVYSDTVSDDQGRVVTTSNPYRTSKDPSYGITSQTYDALGRKLVQTNPDQSTASLSYNGNVTTVTDENGNKWQQTTDALGRLTAVIEPNGAMTNYTYDVLGNLLNVTQHDLSGGARARSFSYDSLSRLITSQNPESGTICYGQWSSGKCVNGYDANGNLVYKTDGRGITTNYNYDALNRLLSKTYSDGTVAAAFNYDETGDWGAPSCGGTGFAQCNTIGRLSSSNVADGSNGNVYSYDAMGRMTVKSTCIASLCGSDRIDQFFTYDLAGNLTSYDHGTDAARNAYYGGHGLTYDNAGRLNAVTGYQQPTSPSSLFKATSYGSVGLLESSLGNGLNETRSYDNRMRQTSYNALNAAQTSSPSTLNGYMDGFFNDDVFRFPNVSINASALPQNGLIAISGWAATAASCPVAAVEIDIDQTPIGYATLGGARPDVQQLAYNNDGHHADCGYNFTGSIGGVSVGTHTVNVYALDASGNRQLLVDGPGNNTITVSANAPPYGVIDGTPSLPGQIVSGGLIGLSGWAIDSQMHAPVGAVKILIDGVPIGYATLGAPRPDVAAAQGDQRYANSGWTFSRGIGNLSVGQHTVTAVIYDSGGQSTLVTQATVYNSQTQTYGLAPITISVVADTSSVSNWFDGVHNASDQTSVMPLNGTIAAGGWAGETQNQTACAANISRVDVLVDGYYVGQAQLGVSRPDVVAAFQNPSCLNSGWSFTGTVSNIDPGVHTFTARAYDQTGGSILISNSGTMQINAQLSPASVTDPLPSQYAWSLGYEPNSNVGYAFDSVNGNYAYLYDNLNRLVAAGSSTTGLQWSYDSFGNRTSQVVTAGAGTTSYETFNANNQPNDVAFDAAGNALGTGVVPLQYDAESRLINANGIRYIYDADGQRVAKYSGNTLTNVYLYDQAGHVVTELDGSFNVIRREVYAGSRHLGTYDQSGNLTYVLSDWLGTERARANSTGTLCETTASQPFGDNQQSSGICFPSPTFFTGKERDPESGLDYFGARYYGSSMGRWMSPDWSAKEEPVPYGKLPDPQTLNLYSYVQNNPLSRFDDDGHETQATLDSKAALQAGQDFSKAAHWLYKMLQHPVVQSYLSVIPFLGPEAGAAGEAEAGIAGGAAKGESVWSMGAFPRGMAIEAQLGGNLPAGFPTIDKFTDGVVTSIKSLDLGASSYQNANALTSTVEGYVDKVAAFQGGKQAGTVIQASQITGRELELAVPGAGNTAQQAALKAAAEYAKQQGVNLTIKQVK